MNNKISDPVSKFHFQSSLDLTKLRSPVRNILVEKQQELTFKKNQIIYKEGSFPKAVYIIKKGMVKAVQHNDNGASQIIYFYVPGELFGYRPMLCNELNPFTTVALEPLTVNIIRADDFLQALENSKELSHQLLYNLSKEFSMWVNRINVFAQRNVRQRLALALLILNEKFAADKNDPPIIQLTKTDLGNYIGTSIEVLVRSMKEFENEGWVTVNGKQIQIKDHLRLQRIAGI